MQEDPYLSIVSGLILQPTSGECLLTSRVRNEKYIENPKSLNLFLYVDNNSIINSDPTGLVTRKHYDRERCKYYFDLCNRNPCGIRDVYACWAYGACMWFGEKEWSRCVRNCLIEYDKENCKDLSGIKRLWCANKGHSLCYTGCSIP